MLISSLAFILVHKYIYQVDLSKGIAVAGELWLASSDNSNSSSRPYARAVDVICNTGSSGCSGEINAWPLSAASMALLSARPSFTPSAADPLRVLVASQLGCEVRAEVAIFRGLYFYTISA